VLVALTREKFLASAKMKTNVAEFVEEIRDAECVDELRDAFSSSVSSLGFDSFFIRPTSHNIDARSRRTLCGDDIPGTLT